MNEESRVLVASDSGISIPSFRDIPDAIAAGRLESRNVREYEAAARHALACGRDEWVDCLLTMAEVEWEHEAFFRSRVLSHRVGRRLRIWPAMPPKQGIRESFEHDAQALKGQRPTCA